MAFLRNIIDACRSIRPIRLGVSKRAGLFANASQAWTTRSGRDRRRGTHTFLVPLRALLCFSAQARRRQERHQRPLCLCAALPPASQKHPLQKTPFSILSDGRGSQRYKTKTSRTLESSGPWREAVSRRAGKKTLLFCSEPCVCVCRNRAYAGW